MKNNPLYLIEEKVIDYLNIIFPNSNWIRDKIVPNSGVLYRPDYYNKDLKIIVEFDGDGFNFKGHYSSSDVIYKDLKKDKVYSSMGIKVIRIPYFVQMSKKSIKDLFNIDIEINQIYSHGFIDKDAKLPIDYSELGLKRFENDLKRLPLIKDDIILSLNNKIKEKGNIDLVLPSYLKYLVN